MITQKSVQAIVFDNALQARLEIRVKWYEHSYARFTRVFGASNDVLVEDDDA